MLNLRVDSVGPDIINVSWNAEEFLKKGVHQIRVVAEPPLEPTPITVVTVNTSASKCSIADNIKPSTVYRIYIKELTKPYDSHEVHHVVTPEGGE